EAITTYTLLPHEDLTYPSVSAVRLRKLLLPQALTAQNAIYYPSSATKPPALLLPPPSSSSAAAAAATTTTTTTTTTTMSAPNNAVVVPGTAVQIGASTVFCAGQELAPFCHTAAQRGALALPGNPVAFVRSSVTAAQVATARPSYINALLIQSRGTASGRPCSACRRTMSTSQDGLARPFPNCVRLPGFWSGACGNCKWRDHGARCNAQNGDDGDDNDDDSPPPPPRPPSPPVKKEGGRTKRPPQRRSARQAGGTPANAWVVDDDE
ncbi:uncharacterized protein B0I36DRAFT_84130, partial [Microdochium trichocladiopsis]